jgi:hypothetical protein
MQGDAVMAQFAKGNTFGKGRPKGSRNKSAVIMEEIGLEGVDGLIRSVHRRAGNGSLRAAAILLARVWPVARAQAPPVIVDLSPIETAADIIKAHAHVVAQTAAGELTTEEALEISRLLENQRRALETYDLEKRIQDLEAK